MDTKIVFTCFKLCFLTLFLLTSYLKLCESQTLSALMLRRMAADIVKESYRRMDRVEYIKQDNLNTAAYEIGYIVFVINEKYRKMIDKYNTSYTMQGRLYQMEHIMYLQDIELNYWEIEHLTNMLHEVERKYKVNSTVYSTYREKNSEENQAEKKAILEAKKQSKKDSKYDGNRDPYHRTTKKRKPFILNEYLLKKLNPTVKQKTRWWWPTEYATSDQLQSLMNQSLFNDLSWSVKLIVLKDYWGIGPAPINPSSPATDLGPLRRVPGIESLVQRRQDDDGHRDPSEDDNNMRLKLFRLMYETVRDSDLKCKRAELIRTHYENSSVFEIGYLMGDVMDKFNIMSDISMTLKRLFHEWKPIEHINAYEQIANQAIEINHLIDIMRGINKKNETHEQPQSKL